MQTKHKAQQKEESKFDPKQRLAEITAKRLYGGASFGKKGSDLNSIDKDGKVIDGRTESANRAEREEKIEDAKILENNFGKDAPNINPFFGRDALRPAPKKGKKMPKESTEERKTPLIDFSGAKAKILERNSASELRDPPATETREAVALPANELRAPSAAMTTKKKTTQPVPKSPQSTGDFDTI